MSELVDDLRALVTQWSATAELYASRSEFDEGDSAAASAYADAAEQLAAVLDAQT